VGTREYFEQVRARKYTVEPHIPAFAQFERWAGKNILEVGCGIGTDTVEFALAGAHVTAIDISQRSIDIAQQRAMQYGVQDHIRFACVDAETMTMCRDVDPGTYDLIYSFGALHHSPHPSRAFGQLSAVARNDTVVKLMLYNKLSTKSMALTHGRLWRDDLISQQSEAQSGCPVTYSYTPWGVRKLLSRWFNIESVNIEHIFPYKIEPYREWKYEKQWWASLPGFRPVEKLLGWHLLIEAKGR